VKSAVARVTGNLKLTYSTTSKRMGYSECVGRKCKPDVWLGVVEGIHNRYDNKTMSAAHR
jgi:hypothetical protein